MGGMLRKLVSRSLALQNWEAMEAFFSPMQFGVGARQGAETIVHAVKLATDEHPEWVIFQTDFKNAYNSVSRSKALQTIRRHFPTMHTWMAKIYTHKSQLWIDGAGARDYIHSEEGAQQGDPLGPFLFCAAMQ